MFGLPKIFLAAMTNIGSGKMTVKTEFREKKVDEKHSFIINVHKILGR